MAFPIATSLGSVAAIIETRINAWWVTDQGKSATHIAWPNVDFTQPTDTE
jgi:hypothetical protein